ncbi:MAG: hypothetical protein ACI9XR_001607 [Flavobacterium sp.]
MKLFIHKLFHWEYWPFQIVYIPIYFLWAFYGIKAKSIFFFNACNPSIKNGGFMNESKKEIYDIIPPQYYPKTILISKNSNFVEVKRHTVSNKISFPCIAKPDIGLRGSAVSKILNLEELEQYCQKANFDYLIQDLIPFENEVGIFYVRFPHEKRGKLTGIVAKEFLIVQGDGTSTMEQLILTNPRYALQLQSLKREYGKRLKIVLPRDEKKNLVPFGNHARGAKFIDASNLISDKLTEVINNICTKIPEFYFGRLDVMYKNWEDLENGINFQLVEINGSGSEPTHIYDPKHSLFFAWKELARHITFMYKISAANNKRGFAYLSRKEGMKEYKLHLKQSEKIVSF